MYSFPLPNLCNEVTQFCMRPRPNLPFLSSLFFPLVFILSIMLIQGLDRLWGPPTVENFPNIIVSGGSSHLKEMKTKAYYPIKDC